jgi:hypothetical protein
MLLTGEGTPVAATVEEARVLLSANQSSHEQLFLDDQALDRKEAEVEAQIATLEDQAKQIYRLQALNRGQISNVTKERNRLLNQAAQTLPFEEAFAICAEFSGDPEEVVAQERALVEHLNSLSEQ